MSNLFESIRRMWRKKSSWLHRRTLILVLKKKSLSRLSDIQRLIELLTDLPRRTYAGKYSPAIKALEIRRWNKCLAVNHQQMRLSTVHFDCAKQSKRRNVSESSRMSSWRLQIAEEETFAQVRFLGTTNKQESRFEWRNRCVPVDMPLLVPRKKRSTERKDTRTALKCLNAFWSRSVSLLSGRFTERETMMFVGLECRTMGI